ncbi:MAG TPA: hypothetical protein VIO38_16945, partial [Rariglobus sp.]
MHTLGSVPAHAVRSASASPAPAARASVKITSSVAAALLGALAGLLCASAANAATGTWNKDLAGNWSDSTKWLSSTPADGAGFTANLTFNITGARTVTMDTSHTLGTLNIG